MEGSREIEKEDTIFKTMKNQTYLKPGFPSISLITVAVVPYRKISNALSHEIFAVVSSKSNTGAEF